MTGPLQDQTVLVVGRGLPGPPGHVKDWERWDFRGSRAR
jgi:hypothetical protein